MLNLHRAAKSKINYCHALIIAEHNTKATSSFKIIISGWREIFFCKSKQWRPQNLTRVVRGVFCSHESTKSYVLHRWLPLGCLYIYVTWQIVEIGSVFDTGWAIFALAQSVNKQNSKHGKTSCGQLGLDRKKISVFFLFITLDSGRKVRTNVSVRSGLKIAALECYVICVRLFQSYYEEVYIRSLQNKFMICHYRFYCYCYCCWFSNVLSFVIKKLLQYS